MGFASYAIHTTLLTLLIVPNTFPATAPAAAVGNQDLSQGVLEAEETNDILTNGTSWYTRPLRLLRHEKQCVQIPPGQIEQPPSH